MNLKNVIDQEKVDFTGIPPSYFLLGLLTAFDNRFQASADKTMEIISWKQFFAVICINLCREAPTLKELADIMGSSHQNVKQILLKLESKGFVSLKKDVYDRRKQRIYLTDTCRAFCEKNDRITADIMKRMFQGIEDTEIESVIKLILKIEDNLKECNEYEKSHRL